MLCLRAVGKRNQFQVLRRVFGIIRRTKGDEPLSLLLDNPRQIIAGIRRHVPRTALRAIVVTHAGPFVAPAAAAAIAGVVVQVPSHGALATEYG